MTGRLFCVGSGQPGHVLCVLSETSLLLDALERISACAHDRTGAMRCLRVQQVRRADRFNDADFYARQHVVLSAYCSYRNAVRPSVLVSFTTWYRFKPRLDVI